MKDKKDKNAPIEIDVDQIDLDLLKERTTSIPGLIKYAHNLGSFSIAPTEEGAIKSKSIKSMGQQTQMQLDQIYEQMQLLAKQAQRLKDRANVSIQIYDAKMSFEPIVGEHYHLYEKKDGSKLLSLVGPDEWNTNHPYAQYIAQVELLADHTWKIVSEDSDEP